MAASRPDNRRAATPSQTETPSTSEDAAVAPALPDEKPSLEERIKLRLHPLDSFLRLLDCAAANRPPDLEDRFRFQWFGLFYQAPEQDAFILRLRLPGGRLEPSQLAGLADITQRHAGGQVLFNPQGGLDLPGVPIASAGEILAQVESIGLSALRTGGDCVQAVRGGELDCSPVGGEEDRVPIYSMIRALEHALAYGPAFSDLPLPCEIVFEEADEFFVARPERSIDTIILRVPARALSSPAQGPAPTRLLLQLPGETEADFLLPVPQAVSGCLELLKGWAAGAERSSREKAGLATFLARLGPDRTSALLGGTERVLRAPESKAQVSLDKGRLFPGFAAPGGRLLSGQLKALERCSQEQRWQGVRLRRNHLHAVDAKGKLCDGSAVMRRALSA